MANISATNRVVRVILGSLAVYWGVAVSFSNNFWIYLLILIGVILILTGLIGWCGINSLLSRNSRKGISSIHKISKEELQMAVREHMEKMENSPKKSSSPSKSKSAKKATPKKSAIKNSSSKKSPTKKSAQKKSTTKKKASSSKKSSSNKSNTTKKATPKKSSAKKN